MHPPYMHLKHLAGITSHAFCASSLQSGSTFCNRPGSPTAGIGVNQMGSNTWNAASKGPLFLGLLWAACRTAAG